MRCLLGWLLWTVWNLGCVQVSVASEPLRVSSTVLERSGSVLQVSWSASLSTVNAPQDDAWVEAFSPPDASLPVQRRKVKAAEAVNGTFVMDLQLFNLREPYELRYTVNGTVLYRSPLVTFANKNEPTQVHLALTNFTNTVVVMWVSGSKKTPTVNYKSKTTGQTFTRSGLSTTYTINDMCDAPANKKSNFKDPGWIHKVYLDRLLPGHTYTYQYGSEDGWATASFVAPLDSVRERDFRFLAYGDMGRSGYEEEAKPVLKAVKAAIDKGKDDFVLHIGDMSYAHGYLAAWDDWFEQMVPIASKVPYMVSVGNHEYTHLAQPWRPVWSDFDNDSGGECGVPYNKRFTMPGGNNNWYSFNYGNVHFTVMSGEHNWLPGSEQYLWIEKDLASVNRTEFPWIVFAGHRPMYTSRDHAKEDALREQLVASLEPVLLRYKVDLALWGHTHHYERTCAMAQGNCVPTGTHGVVHAVIGTAGRTSKENWRKQPSWCLFRAQDYGYARIHVINDSELRFIFHGKEGTKKIDKFVIVK